MGWGKAIRAGIAAAIASAIVGVGLTAATSDSPPWAGVARVNTINQSLLAIRIDGVMKEYCLAEKTHNSLALTSEMREINTLEIAYGTPAYPLRPCP